jgi:hypothetical protein
MGKKAQQHVIPRVYLNAFCDPTPPDGHPSDRPYTGALWVMPKSLTEAPWRRAPRKVFRELNAYTLKSDDPKRPKIEEQLSRLESAYAPVLRKLLDRGALTLDDCRILALFVGALFLRTPGQMAHWQRQLDELQHIYRQVDRANNGEERFSDEYWAGADEAGKRLVTQGARAFAQLLERNGWRLLVNETANVFITSDNPVVHREVHVDELLAMGFPNDWIESDVLPNRREFLTYCPLTPVVSFVACPLFRLPRTLYWLVPHEELVMHLNVLVRAYADELLIASRADPFGKLRPYITALEEARRASPPDARPILSVYTDSTRVRLRMDSFEHGPGPHVLNGRLTFRTADMEALRILADSANLPEVTYQGPEGKGGMRDARVIAVALSSEGETILMNGPRLD